VIERDGLLERAAELGDYLGERLASVQAQFPGTVVGVRGKGLWYAFDIAPAEAAQPLVRELERRGVLVGSLLNASGTVRVAPPLIVTPGEIDVFTGVLRAALAERVPRVRAATQSRSVSEPAGGDPK
jgi:4-aminobutyrate aminotransferase-like enzyme